MQSEGTIDTSWWGEDRKQKKGLKADFCGGYRYQTFYSVYLDERGKPIQRGVEGVAEFVQCL